MEKVQLTAMKREPGKGKSRRLRTSGMVPGILYGKKVEPLALAVNTRDLVKATKTKAGMNVIVDLSVEGGDSGLAFIRDFQADPFRRDFTHVDFQAISMDEHIEVEIPIELVGECRGVKEGGIVDQARRTLHVRSLPDSIPEKVVVDITDLDIGDNIHADDIKLPDGVEFPHSMNFAILSVVPPAKEEEVAAPAEGVEGAVAEGEAAPAAAGEGAAPAAEGGEAKEKGAKEEKA